MSTKKKARQFTRVVGIEGLPQTPGLLRTAGLCRERGPQHCRMAAHPTRSVSQGRSHSPPKAVGVELNHLLTPTI